MGGKYFQKLGLIFFDMSSNSGYMGANYFQEFGPRFFDMSSACGYMGARNLVPDVWRVMSCQYRSCQ